MDCIEYEKRLTEVTMRAKSNSARIDELEKSQANLTDLVGAVKVLAVREENVENDIKEIKIDVKTLASKPAKRWEGLVDKIITTIAALIIGYIFAHIGF